MATILPQTAQRIRLIEDRVLRTLALWGYQEIIPPTFEYLDVLQAGLESDLIEKSFKFPDRATGRILLLRPDVTAQIARIVAMGMIPDRPPLRLSYRTTVFRYEPQHAGREQETFQVGAELIGADDVATDSEMIALMIDCLSELGLPSFRISLGHVGFFKGLLSESGLSRDGQKLAEQATARKDLPGLEALLIRERVSKKRARAILDAPGLYGGEEVLRRGRRLAGRSRPLRTALDRLAAVYGVLCAAGMQDRLVLDLGEFRGFDYYDGIVFDIFADGIGCELGGGGRYNHLIGRFGRDLPSTGFAFDVDRLFRAMERIASPSSLTAVDLVVTGPTRRADRVFQAARRLRDAGVRVLQGRAVSDLRSAQRTAVDEARRVRANGVVLVGLSGQREDEALVLTIVSDKTVSRSVMKLKDVPDAPWRARRRLP